MPIVTLFDISGIRLEIDPAKPSICVLVISVGQPYYEGSAFEAIIRALNMSQFTRIVIVVADTLQRHTMLLSGRPQEEVSQLAHNNGKAWVRSILKYLSCLETPVKELALDGIELPPGATTFTPSVTLHLPCSIEYWDTLLAHSDYSTMRDFVDRRYETSKRECAHATQKTPSLGIIVDDISTDFFKAYVSAHAEEHDFSYEKAVELDKTQSPCLQYLMEELAATLLFDSLGSEKETIYIGYPHVLPASKQLANVCGMLFHEQNKNLRFVDLRFSGVDFSLERNRGKRALKSTRQRINSADQLILRKRRDQTLAPSDGGDTSPRANSAPEPLEDTASHADVSSAAYTEERIQEFLRRVVSFTDELDTPHRVAFVGSLLSVAGQCLTRTESGHTHVPKAAFAFVQETPLASTADSAADHAEDSAADPVPTVVVDSPTADPHP